MVLTALVFAAFLGYGTRADEPSCFIPAMCMEPDMIQGHTDINSANACLQLCKDTDECKFWVYEKSSQFCFLERDCNGTRPQNDGFVLGEVSCEPETCDVVGLCQGTLINVLTEWDMWSCNQRCNEDYGCFYFSFSESTKQCVLLRSCHELNQQMTEYMTGSRGCEIPTCDVVGLCQGTLINVLTEWEMWSCKQRCNEDTNCIFFSYSETTNQCVLLKNCPELNQHMTEYLTGSRGCKILHSPYIMAVTGWTLPYPSNEESRRVELINVDKKTVCLHSIDRYPKGIQAAAGGMLHQSPIVCGGWSQALSYINACYKLEKEEWRQPFALKTKRDLSASLVIGEELYVLGGQGNNGGTLSSVEIISSTGSVSYGPSLKNGVMGHCAVLFQNHVYIIGGLVSWPPDQTVPLKTSHVYDTNLNYVRQGPDLNRGHYFHSCTTFQDQIILVPLRQTFIEVYDPQQDSWLLVEPENMPYLDATTPGVFAMEDFVTILANGKVYKLTKHNGQFASEEIMTSEFDRQHAVYFSIPVDHYLVQDC